MVIASATVDLERHASAKRYVSPEVIKELSRLRPYRTLFRVGLDWAGVLAAAAFCQAFWNPLLYIVIVAWIGARQHGLGVLLHEAAHGRMSTNRWRNDLLGDLLCAWPIFVSVASYRRNHLAHHWHVNTDEDPDWIDKQNDDWRYPMSKQRFCGLLLRDVLGLNAFQVVTTLFKLGGAGKTPPVPVARKIGRVAYYVGMAGIFTYFGLWTAFLLYWIVPLLTWLRFVLRLRGIAEHFALPYDHQLTSTRTVLASLPERLFVAPNNIHYHIEHHLYPSVPFYNLPDLHQELMRDPDYAERARIALSYWEVVRDCVGKASARPSSV